MDTLDWILVAVALWALEQALAAEKAKLVPVVTPAAPGSGADGTPATGRDAVQLYGL